MGQHSREDYYNVHTKALMLIYGELVGIRISIWVSSEGQTSPSDTSNYILDDFSFLFITPSHPFNWHLLNTKHIFRTTLGHTLALLFHTNSGTLPELGCLDNFDSVL